MPTLKNKMEILKIVGRLFFRCYYSELVTYAARQSRLGKAASANWQILCFGFAF